jgi:diguanylate cyclase (GGDEF)-like protein
MSELTQALRSGREREPLGILWDARHWEQDLQLALIDAASETPISVGYMDMNGLKALNDQHGHDAGDRGLRMYFQAVASVLADDGQAYRLGGDEVLALLPRCDTKTAAKRLEVACRRLMRDSFVDESGTFLSISIGIVSEVDPLAAPEAVRSAADQTQYRAKTESKRESLRPSVIAIADVEELTVVRP